MDWAIQGSVLGDESGSADARTDPGAERTTSSEEDWAYEASLPVMIESD